MTSYAGFDTAQCPTPAQMALLKPHFSWCGSYMLAPSHNENDWTEADAHLVATGWNLLDIYVGQQVTGPGSHQVSARQGAADGGDAVRKMQARKRGPGRGCVLDNEQGPPFEDPMEAYNIAWAAVIRSAGYTPIIYGSHRMAEQIAAAIPSAKLFIYQVPTLARTTAAPPFPAPEMDSFSYPALACQFRQNVQLEVPGASIIVDLDVSTAPDPGAA